MNLKTDKTDVRMKSLQSTFKENHNMEYILTENSLFNSTVKKGTVELKWGKDSTE